LGTLLACFGIESYVDALALMLMLRLIKLVWSVLDCIATAAGGKSIALLELHESWILQWPRPAACLAHHAVCLAH
jgi:hypothetical protein